jgi:hypothetical protein
MTNLDRKSVFLDAPNDGDQLLKLANRNSFDYQPDSRESFRSELNVIAGVIKEGETNHMARLLYRATRG